MDQSSYLAAAIATMAVVTYIPRVLPLVLVRGRIQSTFVRSFLYYVPYAVLSGMTIPAIFSATSTPVSCHGWTLGGRRAGAVRANLADRCPRGIRYGLAGGAADLEPVKKDASGETPFNRCGDPTSRQAQSGVILNALRPA